MLAKLKKSDTERVFVPIVPIRVSNKSADEQAFIYQKMKNKNPHLADLMRTFDLDYR